jgi:hypothetical protein
MTENEDRRRYTRCSFCGKGQDQVRKLIAGPGVFICDQCIELCQEALKDDKGPTSADLQRPDPHPLTARELQLAILFAHGMGVKAISTCVSINSRAVEFHLTNAYRKMSASPKLPLTSGSRRDMHDWLSERGLLPDRSDSETILARAISALESVPSPLVSPSNAWPRWIQALMRVVIGRPTEREYLEWHLAKEKALLVEARRAMREPFAHED